MSVTATILAQEIVQVASRNSYPKAFIKSVASMALDKGSTPDFGEFTKFAEAEVPRHDSGKFARQ